MADVQPPASQEPTDLAEKITQYLLQNPCDLIDTKRLMRRFRASVADVERALSRLEVLTADERGEETPC